MSIRNIGGNPKTDINYTSQTVSKTILLQSKKKKSNNLKVEIDTCMLSAFMNQLEFVEI